MKQNPFQAGRLRHPAQRLNRLYRHLLSRMRAASPLAPAMAAPHSGPPRVILFIGHHKVGSSSLQDYLSRNALALLRAGILYPAVETQGHALMLAAALRGHDPLNALPINLREAHNALAFRMLAEVKKSKPPAHHANLPPSDQMFLSIRHQIEALQPRAVILCAEVFSNFAAAGPQMIAQLRETFAQNEVTVMATLRRPDEYLVSWESQRMKFGMTGAALNTARRLNTQARTIHLNYMLMLQGWLKIFAGSRIVLRNYADVLASGGSVEDFCAHCGLDMPSGLMSVPSSNPSIPVALMEIMRRINAGFAPPQSAVLREAVLGCASGLVLPANRDVECYGTENRLLLSQLFQPSADYLQKQTGAPFFPDLDAVLQSRPIPVAQAGGAALADLKPLIADSDLPADMREFFAALSLD